MSRLKDETLSIRTSAEIKQLLRLAADRERRSVASMILETSVDRVQNAWKSGRLWFSGHGEESPDG